MGRGRNCATNPAQIRSVLSFTIGPIGPILKDRTRRATTPAQFRESSVDRVADRTHHPRQEHFGNRLAGPTPGHQGAPNSSRQPLAAHRWGPHNAGENR